MSFREKQFNGGSNMKLSACFLFLFASTANANPTNSPKPIEPVDAYKYPKSYCDHFNASDTFDFIVIGSGPGGATVARRLAENENFTVLLLEAGCNPPPGSDIPGNIFNLDAKNYWNFRTAPVKSVCQGYVGGTCPVSIGKVLGGSSTVNNMQYIRGNPADFDEIEDLGNPGWGYQDMLPYFKKVENYLMSCTQIPPNNETEMARRKRNAGDADDEYHGQGGPITVTQFQVDPFSYPLGQALSKAMEDFGIQYNPDINGENQVGYTTLMGSVDELGYRYSAAKGCLTHIPNNLKVCTNALASKLLFKGKNATGVEVFLTETKKSKKIIVSAAKEYIISGGPYNTPALLERSGIGQQKLLKKLNIPAVQILNGVGENLNNQFYNFGAAFKVGNIGTDATSNPMSIGIGTLASLLNNTARMLNETNNVTDTYLNFAFYSPKDKICAVFKPEIAKQFKDAGLVVWNLGMYLRNEPGSTHISQTSDPRVTPIIKETPYTTKEAIKREILYMRIGRQYMAKPVLKDFQIEPLMLKECAKYKFNSEKEIMCSSQLLTRPTFSATGSASMGPTSDKYVVDSRLKVHGIGNVRVVDSSILPLSPRGTPQAVSYAVGEKGADLIKEDYGVLEKDGSDEENDADEDNDAENDSDENDEDNISSEGDADSADDAVDGDNGDNDADGDSSGNDADGESGVNDADTANVE